MFGKNKKLKKETELDKLLDKEFEIPESVEKLANDLSGGWWNYRLIEKEETWTSNITGKEYFERYYDIHEVYYGADGEIWAWSENPMKIYFQSADEVKILIKQIKKASKHKILKLIKDKDGNDKLIPTGKYLKDITDKDISNFNFAEEYSNGEDIK